MKNKKVVIISISLFILLIISLGVYYIFTREDKNTTLNLLEKQWIESNKNEVIDMGIVNDIPVFNLNGEGLFFDFLNSLEETTGLEFNKAPYTLGSDIKSKYAFKIVNKPTDKDIIIYEDNYALLTKNKIKYTSLEQIKDLTIGVLDADLEGANTYLKNANNIVFKSYSDIDSMLSDINKVVGDGDNQTEVINAVVLPKMIYLNKIIENGNLNIAYNITELTKSYVLSLGSINKLNDILTKYYNKWSTDNYKNSFNLHFTDNYFASNKIDEKAKVEFRSKRYKYGFVNNIPYDIVNDGNLLGINNTILKQFSQVADIEISYENYSNVNKLIEDFNENKLDFFFDNTVTPNYDMDIYNTISIYDEDVVIVSEINNEKVINSLNSLDNEEVMVIKGTQIANYLDKTKIKTKKFNNMEDILNNKDENSVIAIDEIMYNHYSRFDLKDYKKDYEFALPVDYKFTIRDINDNKIFAKFLNFYSSFVINQDIFSTSYNELRTIDTSIVSISDVFIYGIPLIVAIILMFWYFTKITRKKKTDTILSKGDKLRYIDVLTSLKNRNYLNDNIEKWDESEVYPQTIIVVDLNNIAYINDNYGHSEGDKVIKEAANILITNQIENSDIIRTDGNEFLIYLVGYDEKQVVSYIRKLNKEFKDLDHGFGAAIGYSIIVDAIKTIDDAVNEATLDMRNNKEEINNQ